MSGILKKLHVNYISNNDLLGGKTKRKKISSKKVSINKKRYIREIPAREKYPIPKQQLIGLPYDRKAHVESIIKQIEEKVVDKALKNPDIYYYNEYSRDEFDKVFFTEKNRFSVLNSLTDKEIDTIYYNIKKQIDDIRDKETSLKGNEPIEISQFNLLNDLIRNLTISDLTNREVKLNKKNNLEELKNKLTFLIQNKNSLKKIFNNASVFKTKGLSKVDKDTLLDTILDIALQNGDLDELNKTTFGDIEYLRKKFKKGDKEIEADIKYLVKKDEEFLRQQEELNREEEETAMLAKKIEDDIKNEIDSSKLLTGMVELQKQKEYQALLREEVKKPNKISIRLKTKAEIEKAEIEKEELRQLENRIYNDILSSTEEELNIRRPIQSVEGSGIFDTLKSKIKQTAKNIANVFTNSSSPSLDRVQKAYYPLIITRIQIYRTPVQDVPLTLLKAISLGNFDYKSNFDKLYHLYCVLELANETKTGFIYQLTEKTPNIVWEDRKDLLSMATGAEQMIYIVPSTSIVRFGQMIEQLKKNMGKTLTDYIASQYNCQDYILNILKATAQLANTTVPSNISNFIYQDISKVLAPTSTTSKIANKVTDLSHVLNRIGQVVGIGTGLDDNNVEISSKDKSKIDKLISKKLHF
jgi:hypothetical protein